MMSIWSYGVKAGSCIILLYLVDVGSSWLVSNSYQSEYSDHNMSCSLAKSEVAS